MRRPRVLRNLRIDEVSSVDKGAGDGVRVVLMKRHSGDIDFGRIFGVGHGPRDPELKYWQRRFRKDADALIDDDAAALGNGDRDDGDSSENSRHISHLADLLCEVNPTLTRQRALHHLLHDKNGAALVARMRTAKAHKRKDKPMTWETLEKFVKSDDGYMLEFCKSITDIGNKMQLSEEQFTKLATAAAQRDYPNDRPDQAFSKFFQSNEVVRRAHAVVKGMALIIPVSVGNQDVDDPEDALEQLQELAAEQHRRQPEMSLDKCFAKIYSDPANVSLAQKERRQSRARLGIA
jgi:hypothetical protein